MVSSDDSIIVSLKNSIVTKINTLIGNHNESNDAHEDIRESIPTKTSDLVNDDNFISEEWGTFTELIALLDNASDGDTIVLDKNYLYGNETVGSYGVYRINKSLTIDGNDYIIDINKKGMEFDISSKVNIQNVVFQNSQSPIFGISGNNTSQVNIINCVFNNNSSSPIMFNGGTKTSNIIGCEFNNNTITNSYGCIFNAQTTGVLVKNCTFKNNTNSTSNNVGACIYNVTQQYHHIDVYDNTFIIDDSWGNPLLNCTNYIGNYNDLTNKPNLSTVATTGSYNDLTNKPNLSTVATTGSYNDLTNKPNLSSTPVFYGTSDTAATQQTKIVTTSSDFTLTEGTILIVNFKYAQKYYSTSGVTSVYLQVNNNDSVLIFRLDSSYAHTTSYYIWDAGELVPFMYDGNYFIMIDGGRATTQTYGVTKLSSSISSTSNYEAATSSAVKQAYDLANSKANVSDIPTKTSDLTNDSGFLTEHQSLENYLQKSNTNGLVKNDGTIDTNNYLTEHQSLADYMTATQINTLLADKADIDSIPTKVSDLTNDSGYLTEHNPIDSQLSSTSTNAVQNKVVQEGINTLSNGFTQAIGGVYTQLNSHSHGNITNTGTIGTTANKPLITTKSGKITTGSFGTTQNTFCQGNDSRLSDARTPLSHTHNKSEITDFPTIPSKTSDLTNDSGFLTQHQSLANYLQKSNTNGLVKNDGTIDTNTYLTEHQSLADYMTRTQINTALNAKQTDFSQIDNVNDIYGAEVFSDDSNSLSVLNGKIYNDYNYTDSVFILRQGGALDVEDIATTGHTHTYSNINNVSVVNLQINYSDNTSETVKLLKYTGS